MMMRLLPAGPEELLQECGALIGEDAGDHRGAVVEPGIGGEPVEGAHSARLRVVGA
ncbi:MAG: hypothetical protein HW377_2156, partial [Actinobacteria bacterium]|nr:hypothetical protein [Actinomycetota bacterium]